MFSQKNVERKMTMYDVVRYECPFCHQDALEIKTMPGRELTFAGVGANGNPMFTFKTEYVVVHRRDVECVFSIGIHSKPYSTQEEAIEAITSWKEKRNCK